MLALSIVIPVAKEGEDIYDRVHLFDRKLKDLSMKYGFLYEIIVVTDVFHKPTLKALMKLAMERTVKCFLLSTRIGKGGSIKNAILFAKGDLIILLDADLPISPEVVYKASLIATKKGVDLLIANRVYREHKFLRQVLSIAYNLIVNILFRTKIKDHQAGFKIFTKKAARIILAGRTRSEGFAYDTEVIVWAKKHSLMSTTVNVVWNECRKESTLPIFRALITMMIDLVLLRLLSISNKYVALKRIPIGHIIDLSCQCIRGYEYMTIVNVSGFKKYIFSLLRLFYIALIAGSKNEYTLDKS
ncbi:MAG: glycosyltransferase [Candidatus Methanomethylicia archaeon]